MERFACYNLHDSSERLHADYWLYKRCNYGNDQGTTCQTTFFIWKNKRIADDMYAGAVENEHINQFVLENTDSHIEKGAWVRI